MKTFFISVASVLLYGCATNIDMTLPPGPEGPAGKDGASAYALWVEAVEGGVIQWDEETDESGFFRYLKGEKGDSGTNGKSAYDQWVDDVTDDNGLDDPHDDGTALWPADETDMDDFYRYLMGEDGIAGKDGVTPTIGPNGTWVIDGKDTGIPAKGDTGAEGKPGEPGSIVNIGNNGNWLIDGEDTGISATGAAGKSAWQLWQDDVRSKEGLDDPRYDGDELWPTDKITMTHFYEYLRGEAGEDGEQGIPGLSAYDEWQKLVDDGTVDWDEGTEPEDFFRFLKGKDGEDGIDGVDGLDGAAGENGTDGIDGIDGKTAYEIWKDAVGQGIEDPHNPGKEWDKTKTSMNDFYRYMMGKDGADGISAYGLWVLDVRKGIIENPHDPGNMWPYSQTTLMDFWYYLRGEDGEDGTSPTVPIVNPGQPGSDVTPILGKPNVIAEYALKEYSEYVNTTDGSVTYQVYLDNGSPAGPDVEVTDMPGIPGKTYTTLSDGTFKVPKEDLPTSGSVEDRYDSATVGGVESAPNTYVPQKINVRLMIGYGSNLVPELIAANTNELNGGNYLSVPVRAQRQITSEGEWEDMPDYMDNEIKKKVRAYAVDAETLASGADPTAPNMGVMMKHRSYDAQNMGGATVSVRRPTMPVGWMPAATQTERYYMHQPDPGQPDYTPDMFTMVLDDEFYGEKPHTGAIIKTTPVNFHPLPAELKMSVVDASTLKWTDISFDVSNIDHGLLPVARYTSTEKLSPNDKPYTLYDRGADANDNKCFAVNFSTGTTLIGGTSQASVDHPSYTFGSTTPVVVGSSVYLMPTSVLIAGPGNTTPIGRLIEDPDNAGGYIIRKEAPFTFPDIPITIE